MYQTVKLAEQKLSGTRDHYIPFSIQGSEILALVFRVVVSEATVGITDLNPVTIAFEQSWTEGNTWEEIPYAFQSIGGDGEWKGEPASSTPRLAPLGRLKITIPAGESAVFKIYKPKLDMRDVYTYNSSDLTVTSSMGLLIDWVAADVQIDTTNYTNNVVLPVALYADQGKPVIAKELVSDALFVESEPARDTIPTVSVVTAYDETANERRELLIDSNNNLQVTTENKYIASIRFSHDYETTPIASGVTETITIPSTFRVFRIHVFDSSGVLYQVTGDAGAIDFWVPPGGCEYDLEMPEGTTLTLWNTTGETRDAGFRAVTLIGKTIPCNQY